METEPLDQREKAISIVSSGSKSQLPNECGSTSGPEELKPSWSDVWPQILVSFISLSSVVQPGINLAFSGVLIPQLAKDPSIKNFTKEQASWIASLMAISQPIGALFAGPLMDYFGRKKTCILTTVPIIIGWIIIYFATDSLWPIYIARILTGFGGGMTTVGLVYTAEVSHVQFRSMLLSLNSVNVAFGILITTILGVYLEWHMAALYFGLLATISFILSFYLPESPYWLVNFTKTPMEYTRKQVAFLNRKDWLFGEEWERIQDLASKRRESQLTSDKNLNWSQRLINKFKVYGERGCYKPMIILLILFFLQQTSGTYVVIFYTINIFKSVGKDFGFGFNEYSATIVLGVLRFVMSLVSAILSKRIGRRPIMIISSIGMGLSCLATAIFLHLNGIETINFSSVNSTNVSSIGDIDVDPTPIPPRINPIWILVSLLSFVCAGSLGHMVIPWTLMGELLPTKIRASGSGLIVSYASFLLFIVIKTFPGILDFISLPIVFISYAVMSFISVIYVVFFLPETFRKNFVEIANYFERRAVTTIN